MRHLIAAVVLAIGVWQVAVASPCWDHSDTCGDTPLCSPNPPTSYITSYECAHEFCDDENLCPFDGNKQKMLQSTRTKYGISSNPQVWCVGSATITATGDCCLCALPDVIYPAP